MDAQAITDYVEAWNGNFNAKKKRDLAERARKQLLATGWRLWYTPKGTRFEARYDSPEKKTYGSLLTACRAAQAPSIEQESRNLKRRRSNLVSVQPKKRKITQVLGENNSSRVLRLSRRKLSMDNDDICSVCHNVGDLVLCDGCPASFHSNCLNLLEVPDGDWFCPSCSCAICDSCDDQTAYNCDQCERLFHVNCLGGVNQDERPNGKWFCSTACGKIYSGLESLQRKTIPIDHDLTWTLIKPIPRHDKTHLNMKAECHSKLNVALDVMHECFEPVKDPFTGRDLVEDVIFCARSELKRLSFTGFYTVLLEKKGEVASVATVRIYGEKVAEVPLVATRFKYRRQGMCRIVMNMLEKIFTDLGVERLVLPAVASVVNTWNALGFSAMTPTERSEFLGYTFLDFPHTVMCHKLLTKPVLIPSSIPTSCHHEVCEIVDEPDHNSPTSEVCQGAQTECLDSVDQGIILGIPKDDHNNGCKDPSSDVMEITPSNQQCSTTENNPEAREIKDDLVLYRNLHKFKGEIKQYSRRKAVCISTGSCS